MFVLRSKEYGRSEYASLQEKLENEYRKLHQRYSIQENGNIYYTTFFTDSARDSFAYRSQQNTQAKLDLRFTLPEVQFEKAFPYEKLINDMQNCWPSSPTADHKELAERELIKTLNASEYAWLREDLNKVWIDATDAADVQYEPQSDYVLAWRYLCNMNEYVSTTENEIRNSTLGILEDDLKNYVQNILYMLKSKS